MVGYVDADVVDAAGAAYVGGMTTWLFIFAALAVALAGLNRFAHSDLRRFGAAGLQSLEEHVSPRAAEHRRIDEHAAGVDEDANGDG